jgi:hypothetical protein
MNTREAFVERFGEPAAAAIEAAAEFHQTVLGGGTVRWPRIGGSGYDDHGDDPFLFALISAIEDACISDDENRQWHGLDAVEPAEFLAWMREGERVKSYGGSVDFLALATGAFEPFLPDHDAHAIPRAMGYQPGPVS